MEAVIFRAALHVCFLTIIVTWKSRKLLQDAWGLLYSLSVMQAKRIAGEA